MLKPITFTMFTFTLVPLLGFIFSFAATSFGASPTISTWLSMLFSVFIVLTLDHLLINKVFDSQSSGEDSSSISSQPNISVSWVIFMIILNGSWPIWWADYLKVFDHSSVSIDFKNLANTSELMIELRDSKVSSKAVRWHTTTTSRGATGSSTSTKRHHFLAPILPYKESIPPDFWSDYVYLENFSSTQILSNIKKMEESDTLNLVRLSTLPSNLHSKLVEIKMPDIAKMRFYKPVDSAANYKEELLFKIFLAWISCVILCILSLVLFKNPETNTVC